MPSTLSDIIEEAGKAGFSPQETLDELYGMYTDCLVSYPRTDCRYLPEYRKNEIFDISVAVAHASGTCLTNTSSLDDNPIFDDRRVAEHHGIIPLVPSACSTDDDRNTIFAIVCERMLSTMGFSRVPLSERHRATI